MMHIKVASFSWQEGKIAAADDADDSGEEHAASAATAPAAATAAAPAADNEAAAAPAATTAIIAVNNFITDILSFNWQLSIQLWHPTDEVSLDAFMNAEVDM